MTSTKQLAKIAGKNAKIKKSIYTIIATFMLQAMSLTAFADDVTTAPAGAGGTGAGTGAGDDMWAQITAFIGTWLPRLGGATIVIGLVMFGFGWVRNDAEPKTLGIQVCVGGAIVAAVGGLTATFMA